MLLAIAEMERYSLNGESAMDTSRIIPKYDGSDDFDSVIAPPGLEPRFCKMLDALPAAIYVTDAKGCLTYSNRAVAALQPNSMQ